MFVGTDLVYVPFIYIFQLLLFFHLLSPGRAREQRGARKLTFYTVLAIVSLMPLTSRRGARMLLPRSQCTRDPRPLPSGPITKLGQGQRRVVFRSAYRAPRPPRLPVDTISLSEPSFWPIVNYVDSVYCLSAAYGFASVSADLLTIDHSLAGCRDGVTLTHASCFGS